MTEKYSFMRPFVSVVVVRLILPAATVTVVLITGSLVSRHVPGEMRVKALRVAPSRHQSLTNLCVCALGSPDELRDEIAIRGSLRVHNGSGIPLQWDRLR